MNLPFEKEKERDEWKARNHIDRDDSITPTQRRMIDTVDIMEQRQDRTDKMSITTYNRQIVIICVLGILIILHGPEFLKILGGWFGVKP